MRLPIKSLCVILMLVVPTYALFESTSLDLHIARYSSSAGKAPAVLKSLIGNERIELDIAMNNGSQFKVGMETDNVQIVNIATGGMVIGTDVESSLRNFAT